MMIIFFTLCIEMFFRETLSSFNNLLRKSRNNVEVKEVLSTCLNIMTDPNFCDEIYEEGPHFISNATVLAGFYKGLMTKVCQ